MTHQAPGALFSALLRSFILPMLFHGLMDLPAGLNQADIPDGHHLQFAFLLLSVVSQMTRVSMGYKPVSPSLGLVIMLQE